MRAGLLIDTDPALGLPLSDVDDALAIHALVRGGAPVCGLTTVFGNASGEDTYAIGLKLGDAYDLPVYRGADGPDTVDSPAVDALVAHTGDVLAIGPLTNVAAALVRGARWRRLIVLGGSTVWTPNLHPLHTTEFNLAMDAGAAALVLPYVDVLFPMEVCRDVLFTAADLDGLPAWLGERCRHWVGLAPLVTKRAGFHPWDVLPALWILQPHLFTLVRARPTLRRLRGYRGHVDFVRDSTARARVAVHVDTEAFRAAWRELIENA